MSEITGMYIPDDLDHPFRPMLTTDSGYIDHLGSVVWSMN